MPKLTCFWWLRRKETSFPAGEDILGLFWLLFCGGSPTGPFWPFICGGSPTWLWEGSITPPGPAMVRMDLNSKNNNETGEEYSAYLGCFFVAVRPPVFWLWEGSITHPGPAMVGLDRKAPKTKPGRIIAIGMVKWWLTFSSPDANRPARAFRPRMEGRGGPMVFERWDSGLNGCHFHLRRRIPCMYDKLFLSWIFFFYDEYFTNWKFRFGPRSVFVTSRSRDLFYGF